MIEKIHSKSRVLCDFFKSIRLSALENYKFLIELFEYSVNTSKTVADKCAGTHRLHAMKCLK